MADSNPKTVRSPNGRIIFYELSHFIKDIVNGGCCFICGAAPETKEFNDEHIIPDWILRKYELHDKKIVLPNLTKISYNKYKVPCCKECNSALGKEFEEPISELFSKTYEEISNELMTSKEKMDLLFRWLCLIYFKTHLKDKSLRENQDRRKADIKIGDNHWWEDFHHIHCIVRSYYTGAQLNEDVYGSVYMNNILLDTHDLDDQFDYIDNPITKGVLLQLGDFCIASILNDSCSAISMYRSQIFDIKGAISINQFYEIFSHMNYISLHLKERPIFQSSINNITGYTIVGKKPEKLELIDLEDRIGTHGNFLKIYVERSIGNIENRDTVLKDIEEGNGTFLWDENGKFNNLIKMIKD